MSEKYPIKAINVVMVDGISGTKLKGVLIRPEIQNNANAKDEKYKFVPGSFYIVTLEEFEKKRMDVIVDDDTLSRILTGGDVIIEGYLTLGIDLRWVIYDALRKVELSNRNR